MTPDIIDLGYVEHFRVDVVPDEANAPEACLDVEVTFQTDGPGQIYTLIGTTEDIDVLITELQFALEEIRDAYKASAAERETEEELEERADADEAEGGDE